MLISRRDFLRYCGLAAATLGISATQLDKLSKTLAKPNLPSVIWLHGSGCQGDSVSMLNRISGSAGIEDVLINAIDLSYHSVVMSLNGEGAAVAAMKAFREGGFVLALEGGIPTAFNGEACSLWTYKGKEYTYMETILEFAPKAAVILAVGTCAAFGGISGAPPNPTGIQSVTSFLTNNGITGKTIVNIAGCPAHPDWTIGTIVKFLLNEPLDLDPDGRPAAFYGLNVHNNCPRNISSPTHAGFASAFGQDLKCLENLGCRGPIAFADCPSRKWNNGASWCVDSNGMCIGCTQPDFPGENIYY